MVASPPPMPLANALFILIFLILIYWRLSIQPSKCDLVGNPRRRTAKLTNTHISASTSASVICVTVFPAEGVKAGKGGKGGDLTHR